MADQQHVEELGYTIFRLRQLRLTKGITEGKIEFKWKSMFEESRRYWFNIASDLIATGWIKEQMFSEYDNDNRVCICGGSPFGDSPYVRVYCPIHGEVYGEDNAST